MLQKNTIIKGAILLTAAGLIGRVIGFFYRIFLSRAIGAEGVGIYQLIFPLYALTYSLTSSGIQTAISRYVAAKTAAGDPGGARRIFQIGLSISTASSVFISFLLLFFYQELAVSFVKEPRCGQLLYLLAFVVPFGSIHSCINGYYYGIRRAAVPAITEVIEHLLRLGTVMLIFQILSAKDIAVTPALAVYGMIVEEILAALISATALLWHFRSQPKIPAALYRNSRYARELFSVSVPLTMNRVLINIFQSMEAMLIPLQLRLTGLDQHTVLSIYGVLTGMALPLILFPTALTSSLCTMILPAVSEAQARNEIHSIRSAIKKISFFCIGFGLFFWLLFFFFGNFICMLLFQDRMAGSFVTVMAWICPVMYLNPALFAVLNGLGKTKLVFLHNLAGVLTRILFILLAIPHFGINGYLMGMAVTQALLFFLSTNAIRRVLRRG